MPWDPSRSSTASRSTPGATLTTYTNHERRLDSVNAVEQVAVSGRDLSAHREQTVELLQLADPERCLEIRDPVVEPEPDVVEPARVVRAALVAEALHQLPFLLGMRRDDPALARRDLLVRIEAERAGDAMRADGRALVLSAERLTRVVDEEEAVAFRDPAQRVQLAGVAEHVDGDDALRPVCDRGLDCRWIEIEGLWIDVGKDRTAALEDEAVRGCDEGNR